MDLGLRFPSALAFILPASAADARAPRRQPERSPGDGTPKLKDSEREGCLGRLVLVARRRRRAAEGELSSSAIASFSAAHPPLIYLPLLAGADAAR